MNKHTATPWRVSKMKDGGFRVVQAYAPIGQITCIRNGDNAAHIVRCVNAHDELVKALEFVMADENSQLDYECILILQAALAKAKE